jgi:hypothetical protein
LELTQGELKHAKKEKNVVKVEYMRVEVALEHA